MRDKCKTEATPPFSSRAKGAWMSKAARRDVRRAVALAAELKLHSVALHGVVWTLHHQKQPRQPEQKAETAGSKGSKTSKGYKGSRGRRASDRPTST